MLLVRLFRLYGLALPLAAAAVSVAPLTIERGCTGSAAGAAGPEETGAPPPGDEGGALAGGGAAGGATGGAAAGADLG
tara:strand:+ start:3283 stop:3516 length:234 start_codon:yes stop_codon:yes gene_type:complete